MQYVNTCPVLNVEESDRLSFMPYLFEIGRAHV